VLSDKEIINIKNICTTIQQLVVKFDYHDSKVAELCYTVDTSMRKILQMLEESSTLKQKRLEALQQLTDLDEELGL
jgi:hypothetical protein